MRVKWTVRRDDRGVRGLGGRIAAVIGLLVAVACGGHHTPSRAVPANESTADVAITIENRHFLDVEVYVVSGGLSQLLGVVTATSTQSFLLPARRLNTSRQLRLVAHPIGESRSVRTDFLTVYPGSIVTWTIEHQLAQSTATVH